MAEKGKYKSPYSPDKVSEGLTPTGFTSRQLYSMEQDEQRSVAESDTWRVAREVNTYKRGADRDSKSGLLAMGFTNIREADDLFYEVTPPAGWTRNTDGYWTTISDDQANERISMFYKGAFYDRRAFVNFKEED